MFHHVLSTLFFLFNARLCQVLSGLDGDTLSQDRSKRERNSGFFTFKLKIFHAFPSLCNFTSGIQEFMPKLGNAFEQKACTVRIISDCKMATDS